MENFFCLILYGIVYILERRDSAVRAANVEDLIVRVILVVEIITQRHADICLQVPVINCFNSGIKVFIVYGQEVLRQIECALHQPVSNNKLLIGLFDIRLIGRCFLRKIVDPILHAALCRITLKRLLNRERVA